LFEEHVTLRWHHKLIVFYLSDNNINKYQLNDAQKGLNFQVCISDGQPIAKLVYSALIGLAGDIPQFLEKGGVDRQLLHG
jgi:hypothetical protein